MLGLVRCLLTPAALARLVAALGVVKGGQPATLPLDDACSVLPRMQVRRQLCASQQSCSPSCFEAQLSAAGVRSALVELRQLSERAGSDGFALLPRRATPCGVKERRFGDAVCLVSAVEATTGRAGDSA
jgi:hypothetical protein